ncbi:hypothetical protein GCM10009504_22380 [Pseudomonas laurentiana]|nr:hypothetical protein GCM10009504_22380 [Pseudomonas laurentiana]
MIAQTADTPAPFNGFLTVGAGLPAMQAPRIHGHPIDSFAGKPAPTKITQGVVNNLSSRGCSLSV